MPEPAVTLTPLEMPSDAQDAPWWPPGVTEYLAWLELHAADGSRVGIGDAHFTTSELALVEHMDPYLYFAPEVDMLVEIHRVWVDPKHGGHRHGLRLVAEVLAVLSAGRTCEVRIVAEPPGWQSLKQRDRAAPLVALDRHWRRLGFDGPAVRTDIPCRLMGMTVRDFQVPASLCVP